KIAKRQYRGIVYSCAVSDKSEMICHFQVESHTYFFFFFKQKTAYEIGLGIPAEPLFRSYIPKTSAFTLAFSTSQRLRTTRASARTFFTFRHYITPSARNF